MKKFISIFLIVSLMLTAFAGCSGKNGIGNNGAGDDLLTGDAAEVKRVDQKAIGEDGLGRATYYAGGLPFRVGDTLDKFVENGFSVVEKDYNMIIDPWVSYRTHAFYSGGSILVELINECDEPQPLAYCRSIRVTYYGASAGKSDKYEMEVSTREDILANYSEEKLLRNINKYYLTYGTYLNGITFEFKDNKLYDVEIYCVDNLFTEFEDTIDDTSYYRYVYEISALAPYLDEDDMYPYPKSYTHLHDTLNSDTLYATIDDIELKFGAEYDTLTEVLNKGVKYIEGKEEWVFGNTLHAGQLGHVGEKFAINNKIISDLQLYNNTDSEKINDECLVVGLTIHNKNAKQWPTVDAPSFNFYGITENSKIEDIIDKFGLPRRIDSDTEFMTVIEMEYAFLDKNGKTLDVNFYVDSINNCIYSFEISML